MSAKQKKQKLTDWFPPKVKPVHVGLYECKHWDREEKMYKYWGGNGWGWGYSDKKSAMLKLSRDPSGAVQHVSWRGLTEEPK